MLYRKNVPFGERSVRVLGGLLLVACGVYFFSTLLLGYLVMATGVFIGLTGFAGFCPMCYIGGRRLRERG
jgi:hypothetical protein